MPPPPVRTEVIQRAGIITLDKPQTLNALDIEMIEIIGQALADWRERADVKILIIRHAGGRAFCAGGDVRVLWKLRRDYPNHRTANDYFTASYFRAEYVLDHHLRFYPKPIVAIIDGLTMGGGVGLTVHCSHCVATENTEWAMPEAAIGFVPDVGASYILSRLPDHMGEYLGMTGTRVNGAMCRELGIVPRVMESNRIKDMVARLCGTEYGLNPTGALERVLRDFTVMPPPSGTLMQRAKIGNAFCHEKTEMVLASLGTQGEWGEQITSTLHKMSPTSVKLVHRQIREAKALSFNQCLHREYRIGQACLGGNEFHEGVRAMLIDKDKKPQWQPGTIEDVTDAMVNAHFDPAWETKNGYLDLPKFPDKV